MNATLQKPLRVLALDPTSKGFGFVVLEGSDALVDWGVKHAKEDRQRLAQAAALIERYQPDILVVERTNSPGCRRRQRARRLIEDLISLAYQHHLRTRQISRQSVERCFAANGSATKRQIALALTLRFPEVAVHLPPERKPWMSEDERMSIFDALAFAWAFYEPLRREARALALIDESAPLSHA